MNADSVSPLGPKGARLLAFLASEISSGRIRKGEPETFVAYSEALQALGLAYGHAGGDLNRQGLEELNVWTMKHPGLPKVAGLIVNKDSRRPSEIFAESHGWEGGDWEPWWLAETARAIDFDWSPYLEAAASFEELAARVREGDDELPDYRNVLTLEPGPAHIRETEVTVEDILEWLAKGQSEAKILRRHPELSRADIRASLAYAAERVRQPREQESGSSRLSKIASRWNGQFTLPKVEPGDSRMDFLAGKYWRRRH